MIKNLSIVITNHKREQFLEEAIKSAIKVEPEKIILISFETDLLLINHIKTFFPEIDIIYYSQDLGLNELWLKGVKQVKTKWTCILHDDDYYTDNAKEIIGSMVEKMSNPQYEYDLGVFDGETTKGMRINSMTCKLSNQKDDLFDRLMSSQYSISPVVGIFKSEVVKQSLIEARENFTDDIYYPTDNKKQMVGNDLLLWLNASNEFNLRVLYLPEVCVKYRVHNDSLTIRYDSRLFPTYEAVKKYWKERIK